MFRHLTRSLPLVTAVAATVLMAGTPVRAAVPDPVKLGHWTTTTCAGGEFSSRAARDSGGMAVVFGVARSCGPYVPESVFAVARYHAGDPGADPYAELQSARYFREDAARPFEIAVDTPRGREAICLISAPDTRLACAIVTRIGNEVTITPLQVNDRSVARPARIGLLDPADPVGGQPECATCF